MWELEIKLAKKYFGSMGHLESVVQKKDKGTITASDAQLIKLMKEEYEILLMDSKKSV